MVPSRGEWGSLAPQHRIPLKTRRSTPSRGARAAAAGSDGPRGLRRACVVSACVVSARGPSGARARARSLRALSAGDFPALGSCREKPSASVRGGVDGSEEELRREVGALALTQPGRIDRTAPDTPAHVADSPGTLAAFPRNARSPRSSLLEFALGVFQETDPRQETDTVDLLCLSGLPQPTDSSSHRHKFPQETPPSLQEPHRTQPP